MNDTKNQSIALNLIGAYLVLIIILIIFFSIQRYVFCHELPSPDRESGFGVEIWVSIFIISPLNIFILCSLYWLKINRYIVKKFNAILIESILYVVLLIIIDKLNFKTLENYIIISPYIVIIPLAILQSLIIRYKKKTATDI